jgi:hypothetical protein
MSLRQRKFVGMIAIMAFLVVYCLVAMAIGGMVAVGLPRLLEIGFFMLAGIAWLPVVMIIIRWMSRPA